MKKILSLVLAALMLVGTFTIGATAVDSNTVLKFDDTVMSEGGGNVGMGTYDIPDVLGNNGFTVSMDFIFGREGGPCYHPTDLTKKHSSKFAITLGESEGTYKYVGYSATEDCFFLATCAFGPFGGEGADGLTYLAKSETGLVQPGISYNVAYEFTMDTGIAIYLDGVEILSFDLYEDLDYPTYFAYSYFMMYPTHITCFVDNLAAYAHGVYDPATGEGIDSYSYFNDFEDAEMKTTDIVDETTGEVTGTKTAVYTDNLSLASESYTLADPAEDVYCQPQYIPAEGQANVKFQSWLDKKANGAEEIFGSGQDFVIDVTMANNPGFNSIEMDLVNDAYITVKDVVAADGLTVKLDGAKLTITGDNYTGEALATITYNLATEAVQEYFYRYGAKTDTFKVVGADGEIDAVLTNGISKVYNYTPDDLNDDGKNNISDVVLILKIVAKWELPGVFKEAGDVNDDGRTNSMDAAYYLRWIAGWKGYTIGGVTRY